MQIANFIHKTSFSLKSIIITFSALFFGALALQAQDASQIRNAIDSTSIKIGSVINYAIQVEGNKGKSIVFPEGDSFSPLEVIESYKIDTLDTAGQYRLLKQYALTQFDTGHYTIPRQQVLVGGKTFYTDSLDVEVRDVVVDTSKQKLYEIKSLLAVEDLSETNWMHILYWALGVLAVIGLVLFLIWKFGGNLKASEDQLPAYDRAILALQRIDGNTFLDQDDYKGYYSQLTDLAKSYLDEELTENALESTTDELITRLFEQVKNGEVKLKKEELNRFKETLQNADLSKFAAINPPKGVAENDKLVVEQFIQLVHKGKPELTEEERLLNEAYRLEQENKQAIARRNTMIAGALVVLIWAGISFFGMNAFSKISDLVLNKSGASLLQKEWITSSYGVPGVSISTPELLTRNPVQINEQQQQMLSGNQAYVYGKMQDKFLVMLNTVSFRQDVGYTVEKGVESIFQQIESQGGTNILVKDEEFETISGTEGAKVFGSFSYPIPETTKEIKFEYTILIFAEEQGAQQVFVFYEENDGNAKKVMERIIKSVEINKSDN